MSDNKKFDFSGNDALLEKQATAAPNQPGADSPSSFLGGLGQDADDASRGVIQGATLGAAPIIAGAGGALYDQLTGPAGQNFLENYRKHQQESQAKMDAAKARSPWLYGSGQALGALGAGLLTAGATAPEAAGALGAEAAATSLGGRLLGAGATGAALGGTMGAFESKGNLDSSQGINQMLKDTASGAATGAVGGAVLQGAGELAGKYVSPLLSKMGITGENAADQIASESGKGRQMLDAWNQGVEGVPISNGDTSKALMGAREDADVGKYTRQLFGGRVAIGNQIGNAVDEATASGITVDTVDPLQQGVDAIQTLLDSGKSLMDPNKAKAAIKNLQAGLGGSGGVSSGLVDEFGNALSSGASGAEPMDPTKARTLVGKLGDFAARLVNPEDSDLRKIIGGIQSELKDRVTAAVPGLDKLNDQFTKLSSGTFETILGKGLDEDLNNEWAGNYKNLESKTAEGIRRLLNTSEASTGESTRSTNTIKKMIQNLSDIEKDNPGFLESINIDPETLSKDMQQSADRFEQAKAVRGNSNSGHGGGGSLWSVIPGASTGKGQLINKANLLGRGWGKTGQPVADFSRNLFNQASDTYLEMAQELKNVPGLSSLGEALENSVSNKNEAFKNAVLFNILQNPKARMYFSGGENEQQ